MGGSRRRSRVLTSSLVAARLERVRFERCVLDDLDLRDAQLGDVSAPGTELTELDIVGAAYERVDLRDAARLGFRFLPVLQGILISEAQTLELAALATHSLGFDIERTD